MRPIALVGSLSRDRVDGARPRVGGMPYWSARALRALGTRATVLTACAPADRHDLLRRVIALGLPVAWREDAETTEFSFHYEGERRVMSVEAMGGPWRPEHVSGLGRAEWVHVGALLRSDFPAETVAELARGRRLSFDGQGLVRPARTGALVLDAEYDPELLAHVSILKLAEEEAELLVGEINAESLASLGVAEVVVTYGSRGSAVLADGRFTTVSAHGVRTDPTGAGDSFAAGYLASRAGGYRPAAAARRATALVGSLLETSRR